MGTASRRQAVSVRQMPPDEVDINPYASPRSEGAEAASPAARRFCWRVIPTALLYIYGVSGVLGGVGGAGVLLVAMVARPGRLLRDPIVTAAMVMNTVVAAVSGCLLILAARACWRAGKGDWRRAGVMAGFGFALYLTSVFIMMNIFP